MLLRELRRAGRHVLKLGNGLLGGLVVWVLVGSSPGTAAYLSTTRTDAANVLSTAKQFTISDVTALAQPGGSVLVSWSAASWAGGGYSVRRGTSPTGPFAEIVVVPAGVTGYSDTTAVDTSTYSYVVYGLSGQGGMGIGSNVATATADAPRPTVLSTLPSAASTNVVLNTAPSVTFSKAMNQSLTAASFALVDCGLSSTCASGTAVISGATTWSTNSRLAFGPTMLLTATHWYGLQLTGAAADLSGNLLSCAGASAQSGSTCYWTFQTGSTSGAPGLASSAPANGATAVPTNAAPSFKWTAALNATGQSDAAAGFSLQQVSGAGSPCFVYSGSGQTPLCAVNGGSWSNQSSDTSRFAPSHVLLAMTSYTAVELSNDAANLVVDSTVTWTTGAGADTTAPTVSRVWPASNASGINPSATVQVTFSEPMDLASTSQALSLQPWSNAGVCTGALGTAVAGTTTWSSGADLFFHPTADLAGDTCFHVAVGAAALDLAGNSLGGGYAGSDFVVASGTPPTVALTSAYFYPGATVTASGAGWSVGSGNVSPHWDDGATLDAGGVALTSNAFSGYTFSLPSGASAGSHTLSFVRASGATVGVSITVQSPNSITVSASSTDISAGGNTSLTTTVYDRGQAAANAWVSFTIASDAGSRGSFSNGGPRLSATGGLT
ncbi:MAG TPA: Ig-like domain-containing protein, partial [Chloroflexota bacterium]|nr:Ig-like domain-containing protein [Chloroflexota bacterium]